MDLFDEFIKEASTGRVDCGMYFNILFNSKIEDNYIGSDSDLLVPTLIVKDKISFLTLLNKYLDIATIFYSNKKIDVTNEEIRKLRLKVNALERRIVKLNLEAQRYFDMLMDTIHKVD